jgi:hypothetical protein
MSLDDFRQDAATALSTVTDVTGFKFRPKTPKVGDSWPNLTNLERDQGASFMVTWRIVVIVPTDDAAASTWIDTHHSDLFDALEPIGFVDGMEPALVDTGTAGSMNALLITLRAED